MSIAYYFDKKTNRLIPISASAYVSGSKYELCEFYYFRHPQLRPGFQPAQGGVIQDAATTYPEAWAYLQTTEGQVLCKTEEEWQAMTTASGYTGIGGAPFYVQDLNAGTLRLPDLRGMFAEASGFNSLGVGEVQGAGLPNITAGLRHRDVAPSGAFYVIGNINGSFVAGHAIMDLTTNIGFSASLSSSIYGASTTVQPRSWGALACVYLGQSAS